MSNSIKSLNVMYGIALCEFIKTQKYFRVGLPIDVQLFKLNID